MPAGIPAPPLPATSALWGAGLGAILIGLVLLLSGRKSGKVILALALAGVAAACGPLVAQHISYQNVIVVSVVSAALGGLVCYFLAPVLWTLILGAALGVAGLVTFALLNDGGAAQPAAWPDRPAGDLAAWTLCLGEYLLSWLNGLWGYNPLAVALVVGAPVGIGLAVGAFYPQAMYVLVTSLLGGLLAVAGAGACAWGTRPEWAAQWTANLHLPAAAAGGLALFGLILQGRTVMQERAKKKPKKEPSAEGKPKKGSKAESS
jgi:hypothetical protein